MTPNHALRAPYLVVVVVVVFVVVVVIVVLSLREFASASERHHDSGARYRGSNQRPGTHFNHLVHLSQMTHHSVITSYLRSQGSKKWTLKSLALESDARYASQNAIRVQILESVS